MNVLDLFSGIGGFSLGLERAGMRTIQFCEIDPYCRRVLAKHWPGVPCHSDIRTLAPPAADLICGGFPCQDISHASGAKAKGLAGARSGLWREYARVVRRVRPSWVIVENVPRLRVLGADQVLLDLETAGYTCWALVVGAVHAGANHLRKRVWIVGHAYREGEPARPIHAEMEGLQSTLADAHGSRSQERPLHARVPGEARRDDDRQDPPLGGWWDVEPDVGRVADGLPGRVDRLRALGNAVVPQVVEVIGRAIMRATVNGDGCL